MDFLTLSLPEASALYMGLAIQALLRASSLRHLPLVMVLVWSLVLFWRAQGRRGGYKTVAGYLGTSLLLLILFWPEVTLFGQVVGRTTDPTQVASYAASQDPGAEVVTAADTSQVPQTLSTPVLIAPGFRLLLRAITETPLALARTINSQAHRTFASLMPMSWLLGVDLTANITTALADWVHNCYLPVVTDTLVAQQARTQEDVLPWGTSPVRAALAARTVVPGAQTGLAMISGPNRGNTMPCDTYLDAVEFQTQSWLYDLKSPKGTPLLEVFQEELGLDSQQQARFLVYREMLRAAGPAVPAPSLTAQYGLLRGVGVVGPAAARGLTTGLVGWLGGMLSIPTALLSAGRTAGGGLATEFQRAIDGLSWLVGLAVFLTWWGPYLLGLLTLVLIGFFPFVLLWALIPRSQFQPLAGYFVALLFAASSPLWWALVDVASRLAASQAPHSNNLILGLGNTTMAFAWSTMVTVLGILVISLIMGILFFAAFRAVGSVWRGAV